MKNQDQNSKQGIPAQQNRQRPDIRDNMDSRNNEENLSKGDDVTHNKKETKAGKLKKSK